MPRAGKGGRADAQALLRGLPSVDALIGTLAGQRALEGIPRPRLIAAQTTPMTTSQPTGAWVGPAEQPELDVFSTSVSGPISLSSGSELAPASQPASASSTA